MYCYKEKSIEEMTAFLAHEVKNPVSLIKANIELLELDQTLYNYRNNINIIKKELNKITDIISDFLFLFKPINKNDIKKICVFNIIKEMIETFSLSITNIKFYISCFCSLEETVILSESSRLYILFSNIYKNAVESIGEDGAINTIIYMNKNKLMVEIIDSGNGIKDEFKDYIGTPFFTSKSNGSGLGLSICNKLVSELNGNFEIFNNEKKGCTVRLTF